MQWSRSIRWINAVMLSTALVGCATPKPVHYLGESELQYYRDKVAEIQYPNIDPPSLAETVYSQKPRTIKERVADEVWDLHLQQAIEIAIANNKIIRTIASAPVLLANGQNANSVYDPALQETGFLFGQRGVEAALSDFDTQFSTSAIWGGNDSVQNSLAPTPGFTNSTYTGNFNTSFNKALATGGILTVGQNLQYTDTNSPGTLFGTSYSGNIAANFRQPLWAGGGAEYVRIAGPSRSNLGSLIGVNQGVLISRINNDITVADFELEVINMIRDIELTYWDLFLSYRQYDAELANRDSALRSWRDTRERMEIGAEGGKAAEEAQARENYFEVRSRVENSLTNIYETENRLRKLMGMTVNDGKVIRPADSPMQGEFVVAWDSSLSEALTRRPELRRQKWQVKSLELQRIAAENVCNPRLDLVSSYQVNGFGDNLFSQNNRDGITQEGYNSYLGSLSRGDQTGWGLGFEFTVPIGLRQARAQLRNIELQLMKARTALAAQELDISHDLAESIQQVEAAYVITRTNLDRRIASERRVEATQLEYEQQISGATLDLLLRAQASKALAEIAFYTSLVNYARALTNLNQRQGTVLLVNNIQVAEGEWVPEAYKEATDRAWARSFGWENPRLRSVPPEFVTPVPYPKGVVPMGERADGDEQLPPGPGEVPPPAPAMDEPMRAEERE